MHGKFDLAASLRTAADKSTTPRGRKKGRVSNSNESCWRQSEVNKGGSSLSQWQQSQTCFCFMWLQLRTDSAGAQQSVVKFDITR